MRSRSASDLPPIIFDSIAAAASAPWSELLRDGDVDIDESAPEPSMPRPAMQLVRKAMMAPSTIAASTVTIV